MSTEVAVLTDYRHGGDRLHVTVYAGPARTDGGDRRRVQLTDAAGAYVSIPRDMMDQLCAAWAIYRCRE